MSDDDWLDDVFSEESVADYNLKRFWSRCIDEFEQDVEANEDVLRGVLAAMRALDDAENSSVFCRGEQPTVDAAFDAARLALRKLCRKLGADR